MKKDFEIKIIEDIAVITSPYNPEFISKIKAMGGRWDSTSSKWKVHAQSVEAVRAAMIEIYGRSDEPSGEMVTVVVRFEKEGSAFRSAYAIFGRTIASAYGRDSGARVGDNVAFIQGAPRSGGSAKNWCTEIPAGCVVEIYDVPREFAKKCLQTLPAGISAEIKGESRIDREALEAEKAKLMARIAEIDRILEDAK